MFDLMDCGPRRRFVVVGDAGPFIVHNCENVTQAVARDLLADALVKLEAAGFPIVLHVHDSAVAEVEAGTRSVEEFCYWMTDRPAWAADCPVTAEGYRAKVFKG